ncbi:HEAT repeat domain-containing protein [Rufibacter roseus]|uniref:HEAT repeat domain-containing protein n=1 Tax=Rufibacter roseus TaxID=1567108 RepID=A0ABW2DJH4_9BACT|nr:HEAT repeat domain-containing protein [Rufibacter roseus]
MVLLQTETLVSPRFFYIAIAVTSAMIFMLVVAMLLLLLLKNGSTKRQKRLQAQFKDWLVGIVLEETEEHHHKFEVPQEIKDLLKNSFARQVLLQELKNLKQSLSGQPGENLEKLYRQLGFRTISYNNLHSSHWHLKARGIQELAVMHQTDLIYEIIPLTNHKHPGVRMEAQIAMVFLKQYEGLQFFENLLYPLTEWHQVKLLQLLASYPIPSEETIVKWLHSSNNSVVQFALKLIGEQHASYFQEEVIACLSHKDEVVRRQAIACLGEIPSAPAATALTKLFSHETSKDLQMTILAELLKTGTADEIPFLHELKQTEDIDIKMAADRAIHFLKNQMVA